MFSSAECPDGSGVLNRATKDCGATLVPTYDNNYLVGYCNIAHGLACEFFIHTEIHVPLRNTIKSTGKRPSCIALVLYG